MIKKVMGWKTKGMNKDLSVSVFNSEFSFDNQNLRISTNKSNTTMSWVNELGTAPMQFSIDTPWDEEDTIQSNVDSLTGIPIGTAVINHQLVVFTHDTESVENPDHIYVFKYPKTPNGTNTDIILGLELYHGNLNFSTDYPLETQVSYEAEHIQKVYWTDGRNQPRVINIANLDAIAESKYIDTSFDFIPTLKLQETVSVEKRYDISGIFSPGVIQYAFTYYNKYGQESNIFYTTRLYCVSYRDRGANPEEKVSMAFEITVNNLDSNFEYLRIYSIQRTSLNAVPFCKRVQDINISAVAALEGSNNKIVFVDNGTMGDSVDPTELLYKGGESIVAETMEQKDGTLFFGNLKVSRNLIPQEIRNKIEDTFDPKNTSIDTDTSEFTTAYRTFDGEIISTGDLSYVNTIDISGFKDREVYRFGIQFQHNTGVWSEPIWIRDYRIKSSHDNTYGPQLDENTGQITLPHISVIINDDISNGALSYLNAHDYKRARLLMAQPNNSDRTIVCQGIANQTVYTIADRYGLDENGSPKGTFDGHLYGQASWIFRPNWINYPYAKTDADDGAGKISSVFIEDLANLAGGTVNSVATASPALRSTEIGAELRNYYDFNIDNYLFTIHTPELIFEESLYSEDWSSLGVTHIGNATFDSTYGDIDIQTKTPPIGSSGGFIHKSVKTDGNAALVSGLFYEDYIVDDARNSDTFYSLESMSRPIKWPVFMWNRSGSLNNDILRPNGGIRTAELLKKKISNYRFSNSRTINNSSALLSTDDLQLFSSDQTTIIKVAGHPYMGNIDTALIPNRAQYKYLAGWYFGVDPVSINADVEYRLGPKDPEDSNSNIGLWHRESDNSWSHVLGLTGDRFPDLCMTSEIIRMTYKSTPHLVSLCQKAAGAAFVSNSIFNGDKTLPLVEVTRDYNSGTFYGGQSEDALKANVWIPISDPVDIIKNATTGDISVSIYSDWGDTYFQRFDCLKTYARSKDDINQVIDIASFMVESHINLDGRYDRNRGQISNMNVDPTNYNLHNPVYSQQNNFFNYKILDEDTRENSLYPNQITWSKTKESGADVDLWTNVTMASVLELDGDKGQINKLIKFNDQLMCFQDSGISQILYNENVQINTAEGVPIELANSGKVQGKRYLSNSIGCSNKWSVVSTQMGVYFMDSNEKSIYLLGGQMGNISLQNGFNSWCKQHIPSAAIKWTPISFNDGGFRNFIAHNDKINQDVLFINGETALAWNESLQSFTSFYSYENSPYFCNLEDTGIWIREDGLWKHHAGGYCNFFGVNKPYSTTLVANPEPQLSKLFTNLEFSTSMKNDGTLLINGKFAPFLPFNYLEVWNEYQHGFTELSLVNGHNSKLHPVDDMVSSLKRKFRLWRCDIPRNNCKLDRDRDENCLYATDNSLGISRFIRKPFDRMSNPWLYIKLSKSAAFEGEVLPMMELHNLLMTYFI